MIMSDKVKIIEEAWSECFERVRHGEFMTALQDGTVTLDYYVGFLRETFHNAHANPKLGSLFHAHFSSRRPALESRFLKHNAQEVGHDELALADLRELGADTAAIRAERPLPTTEALAGFIAYQIQHRNPLSYLGYLYHLEAIAVNAGGNTMETLAGIGVPEAAMTFLKEHSDADPVHLEWNRQYLEAFVETPADLEAVLYGLRGTCELHAAMFQGFVDRAKREADWQRMPAAAVNAEKSTKAGTH